MLRLEHAIANVLIHSHSAFKVSASPDLFFLRTLPIQLAEIVAVGHEPHFQSPVPLFMRTVEFVYRMRPLTSLWEFCFVVFSLCLSWTSILALVAYPNAPRPMRAKPPIPAPTPIPALTPTERLDTSYRVAAGTATFFWLMLCGSSSLLLFYAL
jgi:hypothetical protein